MYDRNAILNIVEDAERNHPSCICGQPMIPEDQDGALWLACRDRSAKRTSLVQRLRSLDWILPHDRYLLVSAEELAA